MSAFVSLEMDLLPFVSAASDSLRRVVWPSDLYRSDPTRYFREVLGVEPWHKQIEVIEAIRDHKRVAVSSGHKVSKSHTAAGIGLWFFCSFSDARVVMSSTTARQVDQILWRELRMMHSRSGRCVECKRADPHGPVPCPHSAVIPEQPFDLAKSGLKSADFREIVGFTAKEAEAVAGVSGKNLLYILDEASGIPDVIFEAIEGNRAGGARIVMFSNPTRTEGEFFAAFTSKAKLYKTIRISSEETPNVKAGKELIPGLATREWIDEKVEEWGRDSALFKVRVEGKFALKEDGKIVSLHAITQSEARWHETPADGVLSVGLDPAGEGGQGDESVFVARRGNRMLAMRPHRGLNEDAHLVHLLAFLDEFRKEREVPIVVVDREGSIGAPLYRVLRSYAEQNPGSFAVIGFRASDAAMRQPELYARARDEIWANLAKWIREGGAILADDKLARELHAPSWSSDIRGRLRATGKDDLRKMLNRSPDRADALALSVWDTPSLRDDIGDGEPVRTQPEDAYIPVIDPYAGAYFWEGGS